MAEVPRKCAPEAGRRVQAEGRRRGLARWTPGAACLFVPREAGGRRARPRAGAAGWPGGPLAQRVCLCPERRAGGEPGRGPAPRAGQANTWRSVSVCAGSELC